MGHWQENQELLRNQKRGQVSCLYLDNLIGKHRNRDPTNSFYVLERLGDGSMGSVHRCNRKVSDANASVPDRQCCFLLLPFLVPFRPIRRDTKFVSVRIPDGSQTSQNTQTTSSISSSSSRFFSESDSCVVSERTTHNHADNKKRFYAIKTIKGTVEVFKRELENEISILKTLDHPNIVKAIETYKYDGEVALVLEECSGGNISSRAPYSEQETARIMKSLLSAVSYIHSRGYLHRDLKLENCLFANTSPTAEVKIIDFGLAKKCEPGGKLRNIVGTVYTMSPELLIERCYDAKADVWALGVIAFVLLSGTKPFDGKTRKEIVQQIIERNVHFSGPHWCDISDDAKKFVQGLLDYNPDLRPSAEKALQSNWLRQLVIGNNPLEMDNAMNRVQEAMRRFCGYGTLKKLAHLVIANECTTEEIGFLRDIFRAFDKNYIGEFDIKEFKATLQENRNCCGDDEMEQLFFGMNVSGTGTVKYSEFLAATLEAHDESIFNEARLAEAFNSIDSDERGYITSRDLACLLDGNIGITQQYTIRETDDTVDVLCGNRRIDYDEFLHLWHR